MHYIDPLRLRIEFLNNTRNVVMYDGDPLAPALYTPDYLFATTMFCNPLGWFEASNLPPDYIERVASLVRVWKEHRAAIFNGHIYTVGSAPDGTSWTGFISVNEVDNCVYALLFRETNQTPSQSIKLPISLAPTDRCVVLAGQGSLRVLEGRLQAEIPASRSYIFARIERAEH
jgi:alpha-galactosidase